MYITHQFYFYVSEIFVNFLIFKFFVINIVMTYKINWLPSHFFDIKVASLRNHFYLRQITDCDVGFIETSFWVGVKLRDMYYAVTIFL